MHFKRIWQISADITTMLVKCALKGPFAENRAQIPRYWSLSLTFFKTVATNFTVGTSRGNHGVYRVSFSRTLRKNNFRILIFTPYRLVSTILMHRKLKLVDFKRKLQVKLFTWSFLLKSTDLAKIWYNSNQWKLIDFE